MITRLRAAFNTVSFYVGNHFDCFFSKQIFFAILFYRLFEAFCCKGVTSALFARWLFADRFITCLRNRLFWRKMRLGRERVLQVRKICFSHRQRRFSNLHRSTVSTQGGSGRFGIWEVLCGLTVPCLPSPACVLAYLRRIRQQKARHFVPGLC